VGLKKKMTANFQQLLKEVYDRKELNKLQDELLAEEISIVVQYVKKLIESRPK
jgi:hypothetical protein